MVKEFKSVGIYSSLRDKRVLKIAQQIFEILENIGVRLIFSDSFSSFKSSASHKQYSDKYIFNNSVIFYLLLATLFSVVLSMPYMGLMPIFAKDIQLVIASDFAWMNSTPIISSFNLPDLLTYSSFRLGCLMSISGIGALIGSLIVTVLSDTNRGRIFIYSVFALGVTLTIFSVTRSFIIGCLTFIITSSLLFL